MHQLENRTPYAAERVWLRNQRGGYIWVVAVRATFDVHPDGRVELADEQTPPYVEPVYLGEPGWSSLVHEGDFCLGKPTTDVLVTGCARHPRGGEGRELPISMRVADIEKTLVVRGACTYVDGIVTTKPRPFQSIAVVYENAFGGVDRSDPDPTRFKMDPRNPVGTGYVRSWSKPTRAPSVVYPGRNERRAGPAGFGPLASWWEPRHAYHGTFDADWLKTQSPFLPLDWSPQSSLCAPLDQRPTKHLRGGELFEVINMGPRDGLRFELPKTYFAMRSSFGSRTREHRCKLTTVELDADTHRLGMVWLSTLDVPLHDVDALDHTRIEERPFV